MSECRTCKPGRNFTLGWCTIVSLFLTALGLWLSQNGFYGAAMDTIAVGLVSIGFGAGYAFRNRQG